MRSAIVLFLGLIAAFVTGILASGAFVSDVFVERSERLSTSTLDNVQGLELFEGGALPAISFIDENSKTRDLESLKGRWNLLFFGYTYCPDICPMTLMHMSKLWKQLSDEEKSQLNVVLVSVDPARDTPASMKSYMDYFNPDFIALTGNSEGMQTLAGQLNAFYARVDRDDGGYLMDHSANIVLVSPEGEYRGYVEPPHDPARMLPIVRGLITLQPR